MMQIIKFEGRLRHRNRKQAFTRDRQDGKPGRKSSNFVDNFLTWPTFCIVLLIHQILV